MWCRPRDKCLVGCKTESNMHVRSEQRMPKVYQGCKTIDDLQQSIGNCKGYMRCDICGQTMDDIGCLDQATFAKMYQQEAWMLRHQSEGSKIYPNPNLLFCWDKNM